MTIIFYRYIMVCHVEFCQRHGVKAIREALLRLCLGIPVLVASLSMTQLNNIRDYLMCTGREEVVRYNIENFHEEDSVGGYAILLPVYHPYRILAMIIGINLCLICFLYTWFYVLIL